MPPKRTLTLSDLSESFSSQSDNTLSSQSDSSSSLDLEEDSEDEDEVPDARDKFLPSSLQEKKPKVTMSQWVLEKLRGPFLGTILSKEERSEYTVCIFVVFLILYFIILFSGSILLLPI